MNRRTVLLGATALAVAACTSTTTTVSDLQLLANGLAALAPLIPSTVANATLIGQIQTALADVQGALKANPTLTTIQSIGSLVADLAPTVADLFPGGGTAVTIVQAIVALLPTIEQAFGGKTLAARFDTFKAKLAEHNIQPLTVTQARVVLSALPKA